MPDKSDRKTECDHSVLKTNNNYNLLEVIVSLFTLLDGLRVFFYVDRFVVYFLSQIVFYELIDEFLIYRLVTPL